MAGAVVDADWCAAVVGVSRPELNGFSGGDGGDNERRDGVDHAQARRGADQRNQPEPRTSGSVRPHYAAHTMTLRALAFTTAIRPTTPSIVIQASDAHDRDD